MKALPWKTRGARLYLPRDLEVSFAIGKMGAVTVYDVWPLFWKSLHTARTCLPRLMRLGLVRSFGRADPSHAAWYSLTRQGAIWVSGETGCEESELRVVTGISRMNLTALHSRNRLWTSLVLACRKREGVRLALFRPEWELRQLKSPGVGVVPDALVVLSDERRGGRMGWVWMVEFDAGTERLSVWKLKAKTYAELRHRPQLYGAARWAVLVLVPSERRARSVASTVSDAGAGEFMFLALEPNLHEGSALEPVLSRATTAGSLSSSRRESLVSLDGSPISDPDQRGHATVDPGVEQDFGVLP